jgi:surfeit locus 1 family protein
VYFRPLPGVTIAAALLFAILIGLGVWQLQRLEWKLALIDRVERNMHAAPLDLDAGHWPAHSPDTEYTHVTATGRFDNSKEAYIFGIGPEGAPVYHVVVPFVLKGGRVLLVDRGIVPRDLQNPATRPDGIDNHMTRITGFWRWQEAAGFFTNPPDLTKRVWFYRDVPGIARADGIVLAAPAVIEADATPNPGGWPRGGQTVVAFRNEHLQYAITWFLMALALLGVYGAYHVSRGRLGLRRGR